MMLVLTRILSLGVGSAITGTADWSATSAMFVMLNASGSKRAKIVAQMSD